MKNDWFETFVEHTLGIGPAEKAERTRVGAYEFISGKAVNMITVEVPGCGPDDVDVTVADKIVGVVWRGRRPGKLEFRIPPSSDAEAVTASVGKGILEVHIPNTAASREARKVRVTASS